MGKESEGVTLDGAPFLSAARETLGRVLILEPNDAKDASFVLALLISPGFEFLSTSAPTRQRPMTWSGW